MRILLNREAYFFNENSTYENYWLCRSVQKREHKEIPDNRLPIFLIRCLMYICVIVCLQKLTVRVERETKEKLN